MAGEHCTASIKKPLPIQTTASIPSLPMEKENSNPTKSMKVGGKNSPALGKSVVAEREGTWPHSWWHVKLQPCRRGTPSPQRGAVPALGGCQQKRDEGSDPRQKTCQGCSERASSSGRTIPSICRGLGERQRRAAQRPPLPRGRNGAARGSGALPNKSLPVRRDTRPAAAKAMGETGLTPLGN